MRVLSAASCHYAVPGAVCKRGSFERRHPCRDPPIRPEDEPLIAELFKTFSERTISLRFFQRLVDLRHEQLVRICQLDYERELAFVCVVKDSNGREQIIGDAR